MCSHPDLRLISILVCPVNCTDRQEEHTSAYGFSSSIEKLLDSCCVAAAHLAAAES